MPEEKPTVEYIEDLYTGLRDKVYSKMHSNMRECKKAYELDIDVAVPKSFEKYIPPTAFWQVQTAASQIITDTPTIAVEPLKKTQMGEDHANSLAHFFDHSIKVWEIQNEVAPLSECGKNMCIYGMACLKGPLYDTGAWGEEPKRNKDESNDDWDDRKARHEAIQRQNFPLYTKAIDPLTIFPDPSGKKRFMIEAYTRLAFDIKASWPDWDGFDPTNPFEEVEWLEYWSRYWRCFKAGDKPVLKGEVQKNLYGFIPYSWRYSGWGKTSPDGKPEEKAIGVLNRILSALASEARLKTAMDVHLRINVYGRFRKRPGSKVILRMEPAGVTEAEEADIGLMPQPEMNRDMYSALAMLDRDLEKATFAPALSGERAAGVTSGLHQGTLIGQGRLRFRPPIRMIELMASETLTNHALAVKYVLKKAVPLSGIESLKPDEIDEPISVNVSLEPQDPEENDRRTRLGKELSQGPKPLISQRTARRDYIKVSDEEEATQILVEEVREDPMIKQALALDAAEKWGMKQLIERLQARVKELEEPGARVPTAEEAGPTTGGVQLTPEDVYYRRGAQRLGPAGGRSPMGGPREEPVRT